MEVFASIAEEKKKTGGGSNESNHENYCPISALSANAWALMVVRHEITQQSTDTGSSGGGVANPSSAA